MGVFLIVQIISTLVSRDSKDAQLGLSNFAVEGFGMFLLITNVVRSLEVLRRIMWTLVIVTALLGALSLYQDVTKTYSNDYGGFAQMSDATFGGKNGTEKKHRSSGPVGEQNRWAQNLCMIAPLALALAFGKGKRWAKPVALLSLAGIVVGIILTYSRGASVAIVLTFLIIVLLRWIRLSTAAVGALVLVLVLSSLAPAFVARSLTVFGAQDSLKAEKLGSLAPYNGSFKSRSTENKAALHTFLDHQLVGVGPGLFPTYYQAYARAAGTRIVATAGTQRQAHSLYLGLSAELGLFGILSFGAVMGSIIVQLARVRAAARG